MTSNSLYDLGILAAVVLGALVMHVLFFRALFRFGWRTAAAERLRARLRWPARLMTVLLATIVALPLARFEELMFARLNHGLVVASILTLAWLVLRGVRVYEDNALSRLDLAARDNLYARRRLTQVVVMRRVITVAVAVLTAAGVLMTFESARSLGASVLASAGVAGLLAGVAARTTLGNLVAGIQIAFAEPIRLDDVVVVEGEWGNVEEITLTYVVVRLWDRRRLVLPTSYFVETPFQNWTRERAQVIGTVSLHLDYRAPIDDMREVLQRSLEASERWDGDVAVLQVIDASESTIHVRALMSADDAPTAWDLRCEIREALVRWLRDEHPEALPTSRMEIGGPDGDPTSRSRVPRGDRRADAYIEDAFGDAQVEEVTAFRSRSR